MRKVIGVVVGIGVLVSIGALWARQRVPVIADTVGYVVAGQDGLAWRDEVNEVAGPFSSPMAFPVREGDADELRFGYGPGLPAVVAVAVGVTGSEEVATAVVPLVAGLAVVATAALAWAVLRHGVAAAAAALLTALLPDLWRFGTDAWSDVPTMALAAAGVAVAASFDRVTTRRAQVVAGVAAGVLLGAACSFRSVFVLVAVVVALLSLVRRRAPAAYALLATLTVAGVGLLVYNAVWYGSPTATSYSPEHGWYPHDAFSLGYAFGDSFVGTSSVTAALGTIVHNLGPVVLLAPIGFLLMRRDAAVLTGAAGTAALAPYLVYAFSPRDENARFLLPVFPFVIVAIVAAGVWLARRWRPTIVLMVLLLAVVPRTIDAWQDARDAADDGEDRVARAVAIADRVPDDAVLLSYEWNDLLAVYGDRSVLNVRRMPPSDPDAGRYRTELLATCLPAAVEQLRDAGRPVVVVEGATPPSIDPLPILRDTFQLTADDGELRLWFVGDPLAGVDDQDWSTEPCE